MSSLPAPIAAFEDAQRRTVIVMRELEAQLVAGMSRKDIVSLSETLSSKHGFRGWFHRPVVAIGAGIGKPPVMSAFQRDQTEVGSLVSIDLGPADGQAYGDLGRTLVVPGAPKNGMVEEGRQLLLASCGYSSRWKTMGEIFIFAEAWAKNRNMELGNQDSIGHRVLPLEGWHSRPRLALWAAHWGPNRLHRLNPRRMDGMFAINPILKKGYTITSFEEIIYIHEDTRRVLGRDRIEEVGT